MTNNKKSKTKKEKQIHVYRTLNERKEEVQKIIKTLDELSITSEFDAIKELYKLMFEYIKNGERKVIKIHFPEM